MLELEPHINNEARLFIVCSRSELTTLPLFIGATLLVIEEDEATLSQWKSDIVDTEKLTTSATTAYRYIDSKHFSKQSLVDILHDADLLMLIVSATHPSRDKMIQKLEGSMNNKMTGVLTFFVTWDHLEPNRKQFPIESYDTCLFANSAQHGIELARSIIETITSITCQWVCCTDVRTVFSGKTIATGNSGVATGENRAVIAANNAIADMDANCLYCSAFICIYGPPNISLEEFSEVGNIVEEVLNEDCSVVLGIVWNPVLEGSDKIRVDVITCRY